MDVAAGDRVADAEELELAAPVALDRLGPARHQGLEVELAQVARAGLERKVEVVLRHGAVLDHHLVHGALLLALVVLVPEHRHQTVALSSDLDEPGIGGQHHAGAIELAQVDREVRRAELLGDGAVGRDQLDPGAGLGHELGARDPLVIRLIVEQQHALGRRHGAREDLPTRDRELRALGDLGVGAAPGGDHHHLGRTRQHLVEARV